MEKRLEYIIDSLILPFIKDKFPMWGEFIKGYLSYLDGSFYGKIINLTDNNNPSEIYPDLIDDYFNNYFKSVIDIDKYGLTDENKKLYISLSKFIAGMRGNRNGFEFLFKSLTDFRFPGESGDIDIDKISIEYEEDPLWWSTGYPYTYRFILDQSYEVMKDLISSVHPAGFVFEFVTGFDFIDDMGVDDEITMLTRVIPEYDGEYDYDGTITYGGVETDHMTF